MLKKQYVKSRKVAKITFELGEDDIPETIEVQEVHLVGDFNNWERTATPMGRSKDGGFRTTVELAPGREYLFRYLVNGQHWLNDPQADGYVPSGLGEDNCVVLTPAGAR
jgi:1,4-alpha-glucan branching enzyme